MSTIKLTPNPNRDFESGNSKIKKWRNKQCQILDQWDVGELEEEQEEE